ncbi:Facilitated trehalose transporter Tret1-like 30 [Homarus americanus]|uniref:Facilitated trehalose transporter Tret1-like 30 n=1 Tax=Homarus americanus TaxID=6706 RepID=A0A8J5JHW6_HOMAM|nr:Facilitated trehalose transporter Tret1-like 30 [Homarus americanus]
MTLVTFLPAYVGLLVSPESPIWLMKKDRKEEAFQVLSKLRCSDAEKIEELRVVSQNAQPATSCSDIFKTLRKKSNLRAVVSAFILILKEMGGWSVVFGFMIKIFQESGVRLDPSLSSCIATAIFAAVRGVSIFFIFHVPRKPILLVETFSMLWVQPY